MKLEKNCLFKMTEFHAISKVNETFIVRAGTDEELLKKIQDIKNKYPDWANRYIRPGYIVVQAEDVKDAILKAREMKNDGKTIYGPLFEQIPISGNADTPEKSAIPTD